MSKALLRGELDKEFKELESPENSKKAFKTIEKSESEQLPTDCHGVKKAKKRIKLKSNSLKNRISQSNQKFKPGEYIYPLMTYEGFILLSIARSLWSILSILFIYHFRKNIIGL